MTTTTLTLGLHELLGVGAWAGRAACREADPDLFEPRGIGTAPARRRAQDTARRWCTGCPVLEQCRAHATAFAEQGIWGGEHRLRENFSHAITVTPLLNAEPLAEAS